MNRNVMIQVRLTERQRRLWFAVAEHEDMTLSELVRKAVRQHIEAIRSVWECDGVEGQVSARGTLVGRRQKP